MNFSQKFDTTPKKSYNRSMKKALSKLDQFESHLRPGQVYRRADLARYSKAVDRHLGELVKKGTLQKLRNGLYHYPKKASFGEVPPEDRELVRAFLKEDNFYLTSLNAYNSLGLGTTQLYNLQLVYNHKRDGKFLLNGRTFFFLKRPYFPTKSSEEFLLVDLVNNLDYLAEDQDLLLERLAKKAVGMDKVKLTRAVKSYGSSRAKRFFQKRLEPVSTQHAT